MLDGPKPGEPTEQFLLKTIKEVSCKSGILFVETTSPLGCMIDPAKPADVNKFPAGSKIIEMVLWKRNNWLVVGIAQVLPGGKYGESQVRDSLKQYWRLPNSSDIVKPD